MRGEIVVHVWDNQTLLGAEPIVLLVCPLNSLSLKRSGQVHSWLFQLNNRVSLSRPRFVPRPASGR